MLRLSLLFLLFLILLGFMMMMKLITVLTPQIALLDIKKTKTLLQCFSLHILMF